MPSGCFVALLCSPLKFFCIFLLGACSCSFVHVFCSCSFVHVFVPAFVLCFCLTSVFLISFFCSCFSFSSSCYIYSPPNICVPPPPAFPPRLPQVTDLDVFRQLVLNRLTADNGGRRGAQSASSSSNSKSPSSSSATASTPTSGRTPPPPSPSSAIRRSGIDSSGVPIGVEGGVREGERGWGWQARQAQLALWIEETARG